MTASTDTFKVIETIDDRVGRYNFLPTLIASRSRRKQCPLYSVNSESSLLGCAGSEGYSKDWSPSSMRAPQHKPNDSTRVGTGQSSFRGRVRCQSLFIAGERRRCEPGSNSVIVTAPFTGCEGHVLRLGGVLRTRKIFVGCPTIRPFWDQSPGRTASRFETVGNRLYPIHGQDCLRRSTAEAQIQDRSRDKTGPNTAPGFHRVPRRSRALPRHSRKARHSRAGGNPEKNKARHLPLSRRREPREKQSTPPIPHTHTAPFAKRRWPKRPIKAQRPRGMPPVVPAEAGTQRKTKHAIYPFREGRNPEKNKAHRLPPSPKNWDTKKRTRRSAATTPPMPRRHPRNPRVRQNAPQTQPRRLKLHP